MERVLGLDGGGSKTLVAVAGRDGTLLRLERAPGLDPLTYPDWAASLRSLVRSAEAASGPLGAGVFGLPVHGEIPAATAEQDGVARELFGSQGVADNDVRVAFDGALAGQGGVLVLSGTGSMAWASTGEADAPQVRVGGWSEAFGDEGSAFWIGREALAEVSRVLDGRSNARAFADTVLKAAGTRGEDLLEWTFALPNRRAGFAGLARAVSAAAKAGDEAARRIMSAAAQHLAEHAQTAWRRTGSPAPLVWTYAGGTFRSPLLRQLVGERLGTPPVASRLPPVGGAVLRAARLLGWPTDGPWIDRLAGSLAAHPALDQQPGEPS